MRISFLGHASLLVEGPSCRLLCDPLLGTMLGHGANEVYPPRRINPALLPSIDWLVISHRHNDHFDSESLQIVRRQGDPRVLIPDDWVLEKRLRLLGYTNVTRLQPLDTVNAGGIAITATASSINVPELGFVFADHDGLVWNQVDTHFEAFVDQVLDHVQRPIDVVLIPYQSGTFNEYIPLLGKRMSDETVAHLHEMATAWRNTLVEAVMKIQPKAVVPFANGLCYPDAVEEMNSLHFVDPDFRLIESVQERLPGVIGHVAYPGLRLEMDRGVPRFDEHPPACLDGVSRPSDRLRFRPEKRLEWPITPLLSGNGQEVVEQRLGELMAEVEDCIQGFVQNSDKSFISLGERIAAATGSASWRLSIDGLAQPRHYSLEWTPPTARFLQLRVDLNLSAPSMRIHANDLLGLLENRIDLYDLVLGARVRLGLPESAAVSNANVTDLCINPAWYALAHTRRAGALLERMGFDAA